MNNLIPVSYEKLTADGTVKTLTAAKYLPVTGDYIGKHAIQAKIANEHQAHPGSWLRQHWVEPLAQGKWLWAHNARFDLKFVAANLDRPDYDRAAAGLEEAAAE